MSEVTCGVPQGSILGPLLFILYINDLPNCSSMLKFILFADDTNIFYANKNIAELVNVVNCELSNLSMWFRSNKLSINASKSNFIIFGNRTIPVSVQLKLLLDDNVLERVTCTTFLGVFLDEKLNWVQHVNHVANKISKGLGMMGRCRKFLSNDVLLLL